MKKCICIVIISLLMGVPAYCIIKTNSVPFIDTEQFNIKVKEIGAVANYNEESQTFVLKITNNSKVTITKVHVSVQKKDVSGYNYSMYDTFQYKYEDLYFDVNISPGNSTIVKKHLVIGNDFQYSGTIFRWARGTDGKNHYN